MNEVWQLRCILPLCLAALVPELTVRTKLRGRKLSKAKDLKAQALGSEGAAYAAKHPPPPRGLPFPSGRGGWGKGNHNHGSLEPKWQQAFVKAPRG